MTDTKSLSERLRKYAGMPKSMIMTDVAMREAAAALDAQQVEIERLREALRNVDAKVLEDLDRATRNRGARVAT